MKRLSFFVIAIALAAAGCGSDSTNPNNPSAPPTTVVFTAALSPANEVPAVSNSENSGSGNVTITFHLTRDSGGNIIAATADFSATLAGFPSTTTSLAAAHIHPGAVGVNGNPAVNLALTAGEITFTNGAASLSKVNIAISPVDLANQIISNPAGYYFNVHTGANPGGAARGQLVKQ